MEPGRHAPPTAEEPALADSNRLHSATLRCDNCGRETPHRVLRVVTRKKVRGGVVRGVARCRVCRWTHPFESVPAEHVTVARILSVGGTSERSLIELPARRVLEVDAALPNSSTPTRIQRLDTRDGRQVRSASVEEVATVWVVPDLGATVRVSIVEGRRTRTARLTVPRDTRFTVGGSVDVSGEQLEIAALRARGKTWRHPGASFLAGDLQRLYCRPSASEARRVRFPRIVHTASGRLGGRSPAASHAERLSAKTQR